MLQTLKKLIEKHIEALGCQREGFIRMLAVCPENSVRYAFLNLELKALEFRITVWEVLIRS